LKHFFSKNWKTVHKIFPYVDYGLLLQQSFAPGKTSSAVSHDTRFGAGLLWRTQILTPFLGVAGHYSRIEYFDTDSIWVPYVDVQLGTLFMF